MLAAPRRACADDAPAVAALMREAGLSAWSPAQWSAEFTHPGSRIWVQGGAAPVLAALVARRAADELEILQLAVRAARQREGLARRLFRALVGAEDGVRAVLLEVRAGNRGAQAFYRGLGFARCGVRPRYYPDGEDAFQFRLELPAPPP